MRSVSFRRVEVSSDIIQVVPYNEKRNNLLIRVESGGPVYISADRVGVVENGYPMWSGEFLSLAKVDGDIPEFEFWAVAPTATAIL